MISGLIYNSDSHRTGGTVWFDLPQPPFRRRAMYEFRSRRKLAASPLRITANILFLAAAAGILLTMLPVAAMEIKYNLSNWSNSTNLTNLNSHAPAESEQIPIQPGPSNDLEAFSVHIPKIDAHSVVVANIDAGDPQDYVPALKKGVAHAKGTGLPGAASNINRTIYLFAHSTSAPWLVTQYNAQFYLLNKMEIGDEIEVTFWNKEYRYRVTEIKVTPASDTSFLKRQVEKEILVLATCTPPGTTKDRLLVIAEKMPNN